MDEVEEKVCPLCNGYGHTSVSPMTWILGPRVLAACDKCRGTGRIKIIKQIIIEKDPEKLKLKNRFQILKES